MSVFRQGFRRFYRSAGISLLVLFVCGCASHERYQFSDEASLERQMAIRNIMAQQVMDPGASERNAGRMPGPEDGPKAVNTLQDYRGAEGEAAGAADAGGADLLQGLEALLGTLP